MLDFSKKEKFITLYLFVIYFVGIIGIAIPLHPDFVYLTPLNFGVSLLLVAFGQKKWSKRLIISVLSIYFLGWLAEVIGVNGGWLFGDYYTYGAAMGWQIFNTPFTAGILWVIVITGMAALENIFFAEKNILVKSFFGAIGLVGLDFLIEPVAVKLNFWRWAQGSVPIQNYVSWLMISFLLLGFFHYFIPKFQNKIAIVLLVLQIIFFSVFNII
jgi:bisanhydrobacterioruberin hydratase